MAINKNKAKGNKEFSLKVKILVIVIIIYPALLIVPGPLEWFVGETMKLTNTHRSLGGQIGEVIQKVDEGQDSLAVVTETIRQQKEEKEKLLADLGPLMNVDSLRTQMSRRLDVTFSASEFTRIIRTASLAQMMAITNRNPMFIFELIYGQKDWDKARVVYSNSQYTFSYRIDGRWGNETYVTEIPKGGEGFELDESNDLVEGIKLDPEQFRKAYLNTPVKYRYEINPYYLVKWEHLSEITVGENRIAFNIESSGTYVLPLSSMAKAYIEAEIKK